MNTFSFPLTLSSLEAVYHTQFSHTEATRARANTHLPPLTLGPPHPLTGIWYPQAKEQPNLEAVSYSGHVFLKLGRVSQDVKDFGKTKQPMDLTQIRMLNAKKNKNKNPKKQKHSLSTICDLSKQCFQLHFGCSFYKASFSCCRII